MEGFCKLISYFVTQCEVTFCGLATLSMVLNALAIDPGKPWKAPWRWFDESMLDCVDPLEEIRVRGITLGKLVYLAHRVGAKVDSYWSCHSTLDHFRHHVAKCSSSDKCFVISAYHRKALKQVGTGHFTPIGGYHAGKDMVLILDVARFKYAPHWVPLTVLWEGMNCVDESTGISRGFMLVSRAHREPAMLYTLSCKHESWTSIAKVLVNDVPALLKSDDVKDMCKVLSVIVTSLPSNFEEFIKWVAEIRREEDNGPTLSEEEKTRAVVKEEILNQVRRTELFKQVASFISTFDGHTHHPAITDVFTLLLFSLPSRTWDGITDDKLLKEMQNLVSIDNLPLLLQEEILFLRVELISDLLMIDNGAPPK
ncbi:glutathione gamma-glutamylcysteinyltransferase 1-like [Trifolium pratense]|nr:glutathione gamma-glutamylcysteinyltransferase 1-like [Trifolium pratense]